MKNKIILSSIAATMLLTNVQAGNISKRVYKLEKIIISQQAQIKQLKKEQYRLKSTNKATTQALLKLQNKKQKQQTSNNNNDEIFESIDDLDERLEIIETRSYTDKIQLGLGMRVEANNIQTTYANGTKPANEDVIYRTKLNINMKSKIADNLKFSGRLSSYKNWGDSNTDQMAMASMDAKQGRVPDNSSALYVERAYLDWNLNPDSSYPMYLTLGRQPSSDGPSYQIKEGTARKGTYDALAFDGAADGIVFTVNLNKLLPGTTSFRAAYGVPNNGSTYNSNNMKDTKVSALLIDKTCGFIKHDHLLQLYTVNAKDLMANPSLANSSGASLDKNIGDLSLAGGMFEIQHIGGFDFFVHYTQSTAKPNGATVNLSSMGGSATSGLMTSTAGDTQEKTGHAVWTGIRYEPNKTWAIGAEYNEGSKNWFSFTFAPNDPINKLATRGTAVEGYISKKINKYANIRIGYIDIKYDYAGSGSWLGAPTKITSALGTKAAKEKQNGYITFNVLF